MMRKLFRIMLVCCILSATLFLGGSVLAQDEEEQLPDAGITPDSPFYFLDNMGKGLGMFFAFGNEAKAKKALVYAEERLAEARAMANKNRVRELERAANDYEGYMAEIQARTEAALQQGAADNVSETVALATSKHMAVLGKIKGQLSEEDQEAILQAIATSENGQINALRALVRNRAEKAININLNAISNQLEKVRTRIKENVASENVTSENVTGENVTSENVTADINASLDYALRLAELEEELISTAEAQGIDAGKLQQQLAQSTGNRLEVLASVYANAPDQAKSGLENAIENSVRKYERAVERLKSGSALGDIPEEAPALQRIQKEVKERLKIKTNYQLEASGNATDNTSAQIRLREEAGVKVKEEAGNIKSNGDGSQKGNGDDDGDDVDDEDDEDEEEDQGKDSNRGNTRKP